MPAKKNIASSSVAGPSGKGGSGRHYPGKPTELLNEESRTQRHLFHQGAVQCGAPFSFPVYFQTIPPLHPNSPSLHPSQHRSGADGVQHPEYVVQPRPLLLEVLFVYTLKKGKKDIFSSCKRDRLVEWVEKASFACLNKLFEITASYVLNIIPRRLPKIVVPREHFILKDLPFYEKAREADVKARQERLEQREEKRQEGKLKKAPDEKSCGPSSRARPPPKKKKKKPLPKRLRLRPRLLNLRLLHCFNIQPINQFRPGI
ncbi:hypothetical protein CK203_113323 [Vitis vinifera]|uniref:Uncharacterized protein n=1 Tax=Vitis vinifera TaxID=29760 RepID=A0A438FDF3_VITVI|nr:hypothetical protein CK203_113323 [Vitis vinifera]